MVVLYKNAIFSLRFLRIRKTHDFPMSLKSHAGIILKGMKCPVCYFGTTLIPCQSTYSKNSEIKETTKVKHEAKEHINIGTIGHVDHGKTTLTAAITRIQSMKKLAKYYKYEDIDKAQQEKARGITINASHVEYETEKRHYAHTDCPGHSDYIKNFICGASQMDAAVLVLAATDGIMPQTREHLLLSAQIGLEHIVVYVNKVDAINNDHEIMELVELEIKELLSNLGFNNEKIPIIYGSARLALNGDDSEFGVPSVHRLLGTLDSYVPLPKRNTGEPFLMPVDSSISIRGRGCVAIGTILKGTVNKSSAAAILGHDVTINTTITDIQQFGKIMETCRAGDHVGLLLRGVKTENVQRGMVISEPASYKLINQFQATMYLLRKDEGGRTNPIKSKFVHLIFSKTLSCTCRIDIISVGETACQPNDKSNETFLMPGEHGVVIITLAKKMMMEVGQRFTIREKKVTIATGMVTLELPIVKIDKPLAKMKFGDVPILCTKQNDNT